MAHGDDRARLEGFAGELPMFASNEQVRAAASDDAAVTDAALGYLERAWVDRSDDASDLSSIALLAISGSDDHVKRFADRVLFRMPAVAYQQLVPLLRDVIDNRRLAELVIEALAADDAIAANALDFCYHAYGFPGRFTVPADRAGDLGDRVEALRARAEPGSPLSAALARYQA